MGVACRGLSAKVRFPLLTGCGHFGTSSVRNKPCSRGRFHRGSNLGGIPPRPAGAAQRCKPCPPSVVKRWKPSCAGLAAVPACFFTEPAIAAVASFAGLPRVVRSTRGEPARVVQFGNAARRELRCRIAIAPLSLSLSLSLSLFLGRKNESEGSEEQGVGRPRPRRSLLQVRAGSECVGDRRLGRPWR